MVGFDPQNKKDVKERLHTIIQQDIPTLNQDLLKEIVNILKSVDKEYGECWFRSIDYALFNFQKRIRRLQEECQSLEGLENPDFICYITHSDETFGDVKEAK